MPTLNEVPEVAQLLATILTGEPVTHGAHAVIPLLAPNLDDPDWLTLKEAGDRARVTEVSEAGSVPLLKMANGADRPLLLLDGEELIGAMQNRILNTTVLVRAHTEVTIPMTCLTAAALGLSRPPRRRKNRDRTSEQARGGPRGWSLPLGQ